MAYQQSKPRPRTEIERRGTVGQQRSISIRDGNIGGRIGRTGGAEDGNLPHGGATRPHGTT